MPMLHARTDAVPASQLELEEPGLRRMAAAICRDPEHAEDLVQETLVRALQSPPSGARSLRAWLRATLRNLAIHRYHRESRATLCELNEDTAAVLESPLHAYCTAQEGKRVREALARLEPGDATVLRLRILEDRPWRSIADQLGTSVESARSRYRRALTRLRNLVEPERRSRLAGLLGLRRWPWRRGAPRSKASGLVLAIAGSGLVVLATLWLWDPASKPRGTPVAASTPDPGNAHLDAPRDRHEGRAPSGGESPGSQTQEDAVASPGGRVADPAGAPVVSVHGTVVDPSGALQFDAEVWSSNPGDRSRARHVATTDEHGEFRLDNVDPSVWLGARIHRGSPFMARYLDDPSFGSGPERRLCLVVDGWDGLEHRLSVVTRSGTGIQGVKVEPLLGFDSRTTPGRDSLLGYWPGEAEAGEGPGEFRLSIPRGPDPAVRISAPGFEDRVVFVSRRSSVELIPVVPQSETEGVLSDSAALAQLLEGRVVDPDGKPVSFAWVTAHGRQLSDAVGLSGDEPAPFVETWLHGEASPHARTDEGGHFQVECNGVGPFTLVVRAHGNARALAVLRDVQLGGPDPVIEIPKGHGSYVLEGPWTPKVRAWIAVEGTSAWWWAAPEGTAMDFIEGELPPGRFAMGSWGVEESPLQWRTLEIVEGAEAQVRRIQTSRGSLDVRVESASGEALGGHVYLWKLPSTAPLSSTGFPGLGRLVTQGRLGSGGRAQFGELAEGRYRAQWRTGRHSYVNGYVTARPGRTESVTITVPNAVPQTLRFTGDAEFLPEQPLEFTLYDREGARCYEGYRRIRPRRRALRIDLNLVPDQYRLRAAFEGGHVVEETFVVDANREWSIQFPPAVPPPDPEGETPSTHDPGDPK